MKNDLLMLLKKIFVFLLLLTVGFLIAPRIAYTQSEPETLFGPQEFFRGTGKPALEKLTFNTAGFEPPFIFHLRNGDETGNHRVSRSITGLSTGHNMRHQRRSSRK